MANILIGCEYSGTVRDAFIRRGHRAWSCDILATQRPGPHFQADLLTVLRLLPGFFDCAIFHPPCTDLAVSGARHFPEKIADGRQQRAIDFFMACAAAGVPHVAVENPVCIMSTRWRKPDQYVQPWMFGHGETKKTGLWLRGLPKLTPTNVVPGRVNRVHRLPPSKDRWMLRSTTYQGIADAMADQWGALFDDHK